MHIITGLILAGLFGKKNETPSPFIRHTGPIITKHHIEGRTRFGIQKLKNDETLVNELLPELRKIDGIHTCSASPVTGSLVVRYDSTKIEPDFLFSILVHLLNVENEIDEMLPTFVEKELHALGGSVNRAFYDRSRGLIDLKTAIPLVLGAIGIRKIIQEGVTTFPSGLIMVWWAYQSLSKHG